MEIEESPAVIAEEKEVYKWFFWSVLLKGAISAAEIAAGVLVLLIPQSFIVNLVAVITTFLDQGVLAPLSPHIVDISHEFIGISPLFIAVYLLSRGLIKVVLVWGLLTNRLWSYPASLVALAFLVLYQCYQILTLHSVLITLLTLFDLVVMYFIWREYRIVREHHGQQVI